MLPHEQSGESAPLAQIPSRAPRPHLASFAAFSSHQERMNSPAAALPQLAPQASFEFTSNLSGANIGFISAPSQITPIEPKSSRFGLRAEFQGIMGMPAIAHRIEGVGTILFHNAAARASLNPKDDISDVPARLASARHIFNASAGGHTLGNWEFQNARINAGAKTDA